MSDGEAVAAANVEQIPVPPRPRIVTAELDRIAQAVRAHCPKDTTIGFEYDGRLQINIDIRKLEDLMAVEGVLPTLLGGIFTKLQRGLVDNRPFQHRLIADVDC